ncbi:MAG: hypothetical protein ACXWIU_13080, partial [Limisphaerales bacterium]
AMSAFAMGVPFNAVNQVYQLGFPELAWGNDAYLPANCKRSVIGCSRVAFPVTQSALAKGSRPEVQPITNRRLKHRGSSWRF